MCLFFFFALAAAAALLSFRSHRSKYTSQTCSLPHFSQPEQNKTSKPKKKNLEKKQLYSRWPWPTPVALRDIEQDPSVGLPVWDPRANPRDRGHLLPIITPAYPAANSS